jgi:hypothetical protein
MVTLRPICCQVPHGPLFISERAMITEELPRNRLEPGFGEVLPSD